MLAPPPSLALCGVDGINDDIKECRHIPDMWNERPLKKAIHLANHVKAQKWVEVIQFYKDVKELQALSNE